MHQVLPERVECLRAFFADPPPNAPMLQAFFDGRASGQAFVDRPREPRAAAVALNGDCVFFGGNFSSAFFGDTIARLRLAHDLHVVWPLERRRARPRRPAPDSVVERVELRRAPGTHPARLLASLGDRKSVV